MLSRHGISVKAKLNPNGGGDFPASLVECRWRDGNRILHNHGHGTRRSSYSFRRRRCRALHDRGGYLLLCSRRPAFFFVVFAAWKNRRGPPNVAPAPAPLGLFGKNTAPPPPRPRVLGVTRARPA